MSSENIMLNKCKCERCSHAWNTRKEQLPIVCPSCKSPYWNKPKRKINFKFIKKKYKR